MPKHKKPAPSASEQSKLFIEKAREIGCDDSFDADATIMGRIVQQPKPNKGSGNKTASLKRGDNKDAAELMKRQQKRRPSKRD